MDRGITVTEVTYCNSISVAEHVVMMILSLVRNYLPSHDWVREEGWNIADCAARSYDLEGMHVGTVAAGRIGLAVLQAAQALRREAALHRPPPAAGGGREGAGPDLARLRRGHGSALRRGHHQLPAAPRDRAPVRRGDAGADEARRLPGQHRARQDRATATRWPRAGERPARGLRRRRLVPPAGARATTPGAPCPTTA